MFELQRHLSTRVLPAVGHGTATDTGMAPSAPEYPGAPDSFIPVYAPGRDGADGDAAGSGDGGSDAQAPALACGFRFADSLSSGEAPAHGQAPGAFSFSLRLPRAAEHARLHNAAGGDLKGIHAVGSARNIDGTVGGGDGLVSSQTEQVGSRGSEPCRDTVKYTVKSQPPSLLQVRGEALQRFEIPTLLTPFDLAIADAVAENLRLRPEAKYVTTRVLDYLEQRQNRLIPLTLVLDLLHYISPGSLKEALVRNVSLSAPPRSDERYVRLPCHGLLGGMDSGLRGSLLKVLGQAKLEDKIDICMAYCDDIGAEDLVDLRDVDDETGQAYYLNLIDLINPKKIPKGKLLHGFNLLFDGQHAPTPSPATLPAPVESVVTPGLPIAPLSLSSSGSSATPKIEELDSMIVSAVAASKLPAPAPHRPEHSDDIEASAQAPAADSPSHSVSPSDQSQSAASALTDVDDSASEGQGVGHGDDNRGGGGGGAAQKKQISQLGADVQQKYNILKKWAAEVNQKMTQKDKKSELRFKMRCELAGNPLSDARGQISLKDLLLRAKSLDADSALQMNRITFQNDMNFSLVEIVAQFVRKKEPEKSDYELIWGALGVLSQLWLCLLRTHSEEVCLQRFKCLASAILTSLPHLAGRLFHIYPLMHAQPSRYPSSIALFLTLTISTVHAC